MQLPYLKPFVLELDIEFTVVKYDTYADNSSAAMVVKSYPG